MFDLYDVSQNYHALTCLYKDLRYPSEKDFVGLQTSHLRTHVPFSSSEEKRKSVLPRVICFEQRTLAENSAFSNGRLSIFIRITRR